MSIKVSYEYKWDWELMYEICWVLFCSGGVWGMEMLQIVTVWSKEILIAWACKDVLRCKEAWGIEEWTRIEIPPRDGEESLGVLGL